MAITISPKLSYALAALTGFSTLFLASIITGKCDPTERWFAVIYLPLLIGFGSSFLLGRGSAKNGHITNYATMTGLAVIATIALILSAIFTLQPDKRIFLVGLTAVTIQGTYLAYRAGDASAK